MCAERRHTVFAAALWTLVCGLIGMYLLLFVFGAVCRLARPLDEITYGESWLLDGARQVAQGQGLYGPADRIPLMHIAYTPIYYVLVGALLHVFGDSGYTLGRAVSLVASVVGAAALAWSLSRLTGRWWPGLLGAGLLLTQNLTLLLWASLNRVDPLALALTLVGLALLTGGRPSLAAVVFVLAFFTKQTFIAAPIAAAIALWPRRDRLVRFVAILVGGVALGLGLAQWLTHGWFLWHVVTANSNQADLVTFSVLMGSFMQYNGLAVVAAAASLTIPSASFSVSSTAATAERAWRAYFVAALVTLLSVAKLGASSNYWLELTAVTCALLALASWRLWAMPGVRLVAPTVICGALFVAVPAYQATAVEISGTFHDLLEPSSPRYLSLVGDQNQTPLRVEASFVDQIAHEPGELLTDNSGLAVAAAKRIEFEFQIFQLVQAEGHWADKPILDAIAARRFGLVALMHPLDGPVDDTRWSAAIQAALQAAYVPAGAQSGFWLYRPRA